MSPSSFATIDELAPTMTTTEAIDRLFVLEAIDSAVKAGARTTQEVTAHVKGLGQVTEETATEASTIVAEYIVSVGPKALLSVLQAGKTLIDGWAALNDASPESRALFDAMVDESVRLLRVEFEGKPQTYDTVLNDPKVGPAFFARMVIASLPTFSPLADSLERDGQNVMKVSPYMAARARLRFAGIA